MEPTEKFISAEISKLKKKYNIKPSPQVYVTEWPKELPPFTSKEYAYVMYALALKLYDPINHLQTFRYTRFSHLLSCLDTSLGQLKENNSILTAFSLRLFIESASYYCFAGMEIEKIIFTVLSQLNNSKLNPSDDDFTDAVDRIHDLTYTSMIDKEKLNQFKNSNSPILAYEEYIKSNSIMLNAGDSRIPPRITKPLKKIESRVRNQEELYSILSEYVHPNSSVIEIFLKKYAKLDIDTIKEMEKSPVKFDVQGFTSEPEDELGELKNLVLQKYKNTISDCVENIIIQESNLENLCKVLHKKINPIAKNQIESWFEFNKDIGNLMCFCGKDKQMKYCCMRDVQIK